MSILKTQDPEIFAALYNETRRQSEKLELIASENFVSEAVLEAQGGVMTNKYAEGYPGRRYYGGCEYVDVAENLARDRAKALFGCEHVNVQPHSGSQANMGVYMTVCAPGDTILGMDLSCGGHLTHGHPLNFSGKLYTVVGYGVRRDTETIDYNELARLADQHRPKLIIAGASAYPRLIDFRRFRDIADSCGAKLMVDIAHIAGLIVAGLHPSPVPFADFVTSTTHKTLRGPRGGFVMCKQLYADDLDRTIMPGIQGGPLMHVIAAKAVAFKEAATEEFNAYQRQIVANAAAMAKAFAEFGYHVVSGGTDTHLMLLSFIERDFSGKAVETALDKANITVNKNAVPFDTRKPLVTSGIRIGTPAVTTRGMREVEMRVIAGLIHEVIAGLKDEALYARVAGNVLDLCRRFPLYSRRLEDKPVA